MGCTGLWEERDGQSRRERGSGVPLPSWVTAGRFIPISGLWNPGGRHGSTCPRNLRQIPEAERTQFRAVSTRKGPSPRQEEHAGAHPQRRPSAEPPAPRAAFLLLLLQPEFVRAGSEGSKAWRCDMQARKWQSTQSCLLPLPGDGSPPSCTWLPLPL